MSFSSIYCDEDVDCCSQGRLDEYPLCRLFWSGKLGCLQRRYEHLIHHILASQSVKTARSAVFAASFVLKLADHSP